VDDALQALLQAFGRRVRELRQAKGYSQEAFADKCGVHRTFMGTIERGESNLSFQNIVKVAETLGVTLSALFADLESTVRTLGTMKPAGVRKKKKMP
jgi:transcriptional regulator with XRE-family HTH domain